MHPSEIDKDRCFAGQAVMAGVYASVVEGLNLKTIAQAAVQSTRLPVYQQHIERQMSSKLVCHGTADEAEQLHHAGC